MAKHSEILDHPADIGLTARADTLGELMEALAEGLAGIVCDCGQVQPAQRRTLEVAAEDREALAVDFLTAVMNLIQTRHFMVASAAVRVTDEPVSCRVIAELAGEPYDPSRHEIDVEIKAVTYHQLRIAQEGGQWTARIIFDI
jgi:SHS2 domain-containing protein